MRIRHINYYHGQVAAGDREGLVVSTARGNNHAVITAYSVLLLVKKKNRTYHIN